MFQFRLRTLLVGVTLWAVFLGLTSILGTLGPPIFFLVLFVGTWTTSHKYLRQSAMMACGGAAFMCSGLPLGADFAGVSIILGLLPMITGLIGLGANLADRGSPSAEEPAEASAEQR